MKEKEIVRLPTYPALSLKLVHQQSLHVIVAPFLWYATQSDDVY